jgi:hypothetical protein
MALSLTAVMADSFRMAGVRWFRPMGKDRAGRLVEELKSRLPNSGELNDPALKQELAPRGYYRAGFYLNQTLPRLTIGYNFDARECELLSSLDWSEALRLFIGSNFTLDRAGQMLTAFYRHYPAKAVILLKHLAENYVERDREPFARELELAVFEGLMKETDGAAGRMWRDYFYADAAYAIYLLNNISLQENRAERAEIMKQALAGAGPLTKDDDFLLQSVMMEANGLDFDLPLVMLELNDQAINAAFGKMGLGFLTDQLVRNFLFDAAPDTTDKTLIYRAVATLGAKKAYKLFDHLTWYGQILDRPAEFFREYPSAKIFSAKIGESAQAAADVIAPLIIDGIKKARVATLE